MPVSLEKTAPAKLNTSQPHHHAHPSAVLSGCGRDAEEEACVPGAGLLNGAGGGGGVGGG